jgi:ADP-heptose:LPS heptosyltransferase
MLLKRYTGEIVEGNPYLNELIWYDDGDRLVPFFRMRAEIRKRRFDAVVIVYPRHRLAWLMALARIPVRVGTGFRIYSFLFNRKVYEHRKDAARHELEYNISLLRQLDCQASDKPRFVISIPDGVRQRAKEILAPAGGKPVVVVHPGSGGSAREWGAERFGALADELIRGDHVAVFVTGTDAEDAKVNEVIRHTGGRAISLVGKLSVKELAAVIERAVLFVANSTGPLHIAAAMGTPVIGIYPQHTAMSARRWGPWTERKRVFVPERPVDCMVCTVEGKTCECMSSIHVSHVLAGARDLLRQGKGSQDSSPDKVSA